MARTESFWQTGTGGTYLETISPSGYDILINGTSKYINFNTVVGSTGYGFRDNAGTIEFKNSGGSWTGVGTGGGGGTLAATSALSTDATKSLYTMTSTIPVEFKRSGGTSLLYLDETSGNVGIGTTAPDGTLHVHTATAGSVTAHSDADDLVVENSGNGGISILTPDANIGEIAFGSPSDSIGSTIRWKFNDSEMIVGTAYAGAHLSLYSGNYVEAVRINSAGNVGIGTTAPQGKLHIATGYATSGLSTSLGGSTGTFYLAGGGSSPNAGQLVFGDNSGWRFNIGTSNAGTFTERLTILDTGNVGIGTTNPDSKLYVNGTGYFSDAVNFGASSGLTAIKLASWDLLRWDTSNQVSFGGISVGTWQVLKFYTDNSERMRIDASGNVGIGTAGPDRKLDILDASNPQLRLTNVDGATYSDLETDSSGILKITPTGGRMYLVGTGGVSSYIGMTHTDNSANYLAGIGVDTGTAPMFGVVVSDTLGGGITTRPFFSVSSSTGTPFIAFYNKVGLLDATTPTYDLSIGGTVARTISTERNTTAATAGQGLTLASGGAIAGTADLAGGDLTLKSGISTGSGSSAIHFYTATAAGTGTADNTPTEKMTILGSGNVGIGVVTPGNKLTVTAPTTADALADVMIGASATTQKGLVIQAKASQTAAVFQVQRSDGLIESEINISAGGIMYNRGGISGGGATGQAGAVWNIDVNGTFSIPSSAQIYWNGGDVGFARASAGVLNVRGTGTVDPVGSMAMLHHYGGTLTTADALADNYFATSATTQKGLVIQGKASQTANLQEWQNSSGTALAAVTASGTIELGHATDTTLSRSAAGVVAIEGVPIPMVGTILTAPRGLGFVSNATETTYCDTINIDPTESLLGDIVPVAGTLANLWIDVYDNVLDAGSTVFTLRKNGADTTITITVAFGVTSITGDTTHSTTVAAGDRITLKAVSAGTTGSVYFGFSYQIK